MLEYERIDISNEIDVDMSGKSNLDKSFSYGPYLCDGCKNVINLKILLLFILKKVYTEFVFCI